MTRAEEVVTRLTNLQIAAILGEPARGSAKPKLVKMGVMELREKPRVYAWASQHYEYHLTPLGEQVRALLLEKKDA